MENVNLDALLNSKIEALKKAEDSVIELKSQISKIQSLQEETLRLAAQPTEFESYLSHHRQPDITVVNSINSVEHSSQTESITSSLNQPKKKSLQDTIITVLNDGIAKNVNQILDEVNLILGRTTTHRSVGVTLSNLKMRGLVDSAGYGLYKSKQPEKDETDTTVNNVGFDVQPNTPTEGN